MRDDRFLPPFDAIDEPPPDPPGDPLPLPLPLPPLPRQPPGVPWPSTAGSGGDWPMGTPPAGSDLADRLDEAFDDSGPLSRTFAVVVVHRGRVVAERYQGAVEHFDRQAEPVGPDTPLLGWSMAKSMLHATVGILLEGGELRLDRPAPVPRWRSAGDPRGQITLDHLLSMRDGLDFAEDYVDARASDVIEMLFGRGQDDTAAFAADRGLAAAPGERFNYSSGASNIVSGVVARAVGPGDPYRRFLDEHLFAPIGAASAMPTLDAAGTWVASSYLHATARDFARFGLLYLRGGLWGQRRVVPAPWVDTARRARSVDPDDGQLHSAHWWVVPDGRGTFACQGYEGQSITICPSADLVLVRLGRTGAEHYPHLRRWRADVVAAFGDGDPAQAPS